MKQSYFILLTLFLSASAVFSQVVTVTPAFPTENDSVVIVFDASQGNGELLGATDVWAHTGVITNQSTSSTAWRHVQGNWGTADNRVKMTALGNNLHQISFDIRPFYNVPTAETVQRLAFVFRNQDGSLVGRASDGSDIFIDLFQGGFVTRFAIPESNNLILNATDTLIIRGETSQNATIELFVDGVLASSVSNSTVLDFDLPVSTYGIGNKLVTLKGTSGSDEAWDTLRYLARQQTPIAAIPTGREEGVHIIDEQTVYFQLRAPGKAYSYLIGDFNNWQFDANFEMNLSPDSVFFWFELTGLTPAQEYRYQYYVDKEGIRIADPYAEKILDPWNDPFIPSASYPNLLPYPTGKTNFPVGVINTQPVDYQWDESYAYHRPHKDNLVVYELLIRDFDDRRTYKSVIDRLPYLDSLGVNAIELLPVMEFEGNESWGYNPMFFMAPDKYYGTKNDLKMLIDSCHRRGMAVIMDIAMNHAFGQSPMVRLYFDPSAGDFGQPTPESPWFNPVPKHDFNVGFDFNHESAATQHFTKRVFRHWVEEYKIDGYRFDLSKGFTQNNTLGNIAAWNAFDQSRVDLWEMYGNDLWAIDTGLYLILEHFADNPEETVLSDMGFMLWGDNSHQYSEAVMGYPSNLYGATHLSRGWDDMNLKAYMESHDEQRMQYKNLEFGRVTSAYSAREPEVGLARIEAAAQMLLAIPGPKMLWQFGEVGYDYPINYCPDGTINEGCRTANKPIRWDYMEEAPRIKLFQAFARMIKLHTRHEIFRSTTYETNAHPFVKRLTITGQDNESYLIALANFNFIAESIVPNWPETGWWYEYHSGDSIEVTSTTQPVLLERSAYKLYTNFKIDIEPEVIAPGDTTPPREPEDLTRVFPNPFTDAVTFELGTKGTDQAFIRIYSLSGQVLWSQVINSLQNEIRVIHWDGTTTGGSPLAPGMYFYEIQRRNETVTGKIIKTTP
ncbi:MAG: T9SS type A sorting domain-containing protein [Schleiferiaceae bacterium]|nr:T9SS type A sorting domain-containing protein [Schleiferiaceae bacterium]